MKFLNMLFLIRSALAETAARDVELETSGLVRNNNFSSHMRHEATMVRRNGWMTVNHFGS